MKAEFTMCRNDMAWRLLWWPECKGESETIRWSGYSDGFWWGNVSKSDNFQVRTAKDGTVLRLNPYTNEVTIVK